MKLTIGNLKGVLKDDELKALGTPKLDDIKKLDKYIKFTNTQSQLITLLTNYIKAEEDYLKKTISDNDYLQKQYMGTATSVLGKAQALLMPKTFEAKQEKIQSGFETGVSNISS
jgi:hypothetical protein